VAQLKSKLRELNLEVTGTKLQLKERLEKHVSKKPAAELTKDQLLVEIKKVIPGDTVVPVKTKKSVLEEIYGKIVNEDLEKLTKQQVFDRLKEVGVKDLPNQKETKENLTQLYKRQIIQSLLGNGQKVDSGSTKTSMESPLKLPTVTALTCKDKSASKSRESEVERMTKEQMRKVLEEKGVTFARKKEPKEVYVQLYNTIVLNNEGQTNDQIKELLKKEGVDVTPAKATKKELIDLLKAALLRKVA
jgi:hypothetical protein